MGDGKTRFYSHCYGLKSRIDSERPALATFGVETRNTDENGTELSYELIAGNGFFGAGRLARYFGQKLIILTQWKHGDKDSLITYLFICDRSLTRLVDSWVKEQKGLEFIVKPMYVPTNTH